LILAVLIGGLQTVLAFEGLLYVGQQWSWLAAFFLAILASLAVAWILAWSIGNLVVSFKLGRNRLRHLSRI